MLDVEGSGLAQANFGGTLELDAGVDDDFATGEGVIGVLPFNE